MSTFLFDKTVFGPVKSRRLGVSLGINLLPKSRKICNFDCVYCECGLNSDHTSTEPLPTRDQVRADLAEKLEEMHTSGEAPDVITFAGNGEPTMHPDFAGIIDDTIALRDKWFKNARVSVLSNSTMLHKADVVSALMKVDQNILKLDAGAYETIENLNQPVGIFDYDNLIENLKQFGGKLIIQTMFTRGEVNGKLIDNTGLIDLVAWQKAIDFIAPQEVMIYTIERDTPHNGLKKIPKDELETIAKRVRRENRTVTVYG